MIVTSKFDTQSTDVLDNLFVNGCCVDLTIKTWQARMNAKSFLEDLGVQDQAWSDNIMTGGHIKLIDDDIRKSFHQYEVRARVWLEQNSYSFMNVRFVPYSALDVLMNGDGDKPGLNQIREEFIDAVQVFLNKFDAIREEYIERKSKLNPKYRNLLENAYPTKSEVAQKFLFDFFCYQVQIPQSSDFDNEALNKVLQSKAAQFVAEAEISLKAKILDALGKFARVLSSDNTVKSSSFNAIRKSIENFEILSFVNDDNGSSISSLKELLEAIKDIQNIDSDNVELKKKILDCTLTVIDNINSTEE